MSGENPKGSVKSWLDEIEDAKRQIYYAERAGNQECAQFWRQQLAEIEASSPTAGDNNGSAT